MKKLFDQNNEHISEKAFSQHLFVSVISILLCLVALCSMTYAWYSDDSISNNNTLSSGYFSLEVRITKHGDGISPDTEITSTASDGAAGSESYNLTAGTYTVVLDMDNAATSKGYCAVTIGDVAHHTVALVSDNAADGAEYPANDPFSFILVVKENNTVVEFKQRWGVSASAFIEKDQTYSTDDWKQTP